MFGSFWNWLGSLFGGGAPTPPPCVPDPPFDGCIPSGWIGL